jgi:hypothetical protein
MYNPVLLLHSWVRWLVLIAGLVLIVRSAMGLSGGKHWSALEERAALFFTVGLDVQFLLGLLLYGVLSPFVRLAMSDVGAAMRDGDLRFWLVEHLVGMLIALALAHVGRVRIRRAADDGSKHRQALIFMGIALAVILLSIPWPGMPSGRPLLRF